MMVKETLSVVTRARVSMSTRGRGRAATRGNAVAENGPVPERAFVRPPNAPKDDNTWRNMTILVDKPKGYTSFDVVARVRRLSKQRGVKKVGHCGTLDPMATGLLILCVGRATKSVDEYTGMDKTYTGTIRLGEGTPSQDADEAVNEREPWEHVTDEELRERARALTGPIEQLPPMYSAIKVDGKRLYKSAREGVEVERKTRPVVIHEFHVERDSEDAQSVHFSAHVSKGTYVRTLAYDLCKSLGTTGHLTALRRTKIGGEFDVEDAWSIEQLAAACGEDPSKFQKRERGATGGGKKSQKKKKSEENGKVEKAGNEKVGLITRLVGLLKRLVRFGVK